MSETPLNNSTTLRDLEISFVKDGKYLEMAQVLRQKAFFSKQGKDQDEFDTFCTHLVVIDKNNQRALGTYRLLLRSAADQAKGFYSETRFDLSNIKKNCQGQILELGRSCIDETYRSLRIIPLMWKEIIKYIKEHDVRYILGCVGFPESSPQEVGKMYSYLKQNFYAPEQLQAAPLAGKEYAYQFSGKEVFDDSFFKKLPTLMQGYLKMGAVLCCQPALNREANRVLFLMLLRVSDMNVSYRNKFT